MKTNHSVVVYFGVIDLKAVRKKNGKKIQLLFSMKLFVSKTIIILSNIRNRESERDGRGRETQRGEGKEYEENDIEKYVRSKLCARANGKEK